MSSDPEKFHIDAQDVSRKAPPSLEERMSTLNRTLPFSDESEKGVLSCLLQDPEDRVSECRVELPAEAFYHAANRTVYLALLDMADVGMPIDAITLTNRLRDSGKLDKIGGPSAVSELYTWVPIPAHYPFYKKEIRNKWRCRQLVDAATAIIETVHDFGKEDAAASAEDLVSSAQERIFALTDAVVEGDGGEEHSDVVDRTLERVQKQIEENTVIPAERVPFGFSEVDRMMWGAVRGMMIVLAGRPGMGKSALAKDIVENVSLGKAHYVEWDRETWAHHRIKRRVMLVNLEMTNDQSVTRELVGGAGLSLQAMRYGQVNHQALDMLGQRAREIYPANVRMYDKPGMSIQRLRAIARRRKRKHGLDLVVVDYLQLMHSESRRAQGNRQQEIAEISGGLKEMAKELDCVVLALAQLNRGVEDRKGAVPMLSDLRESGSIEQDADVVMLLHRACYYDEEAPKDAATLHIAKGRDIGIGELPLRFDGPKTRFHSATVNLFSNDDEKRQH